MESTMKLFLALAAALLLSSCASAPQMHSDFAAAPDAYGPTSTSDPRLRQPRFYMNDSDDLPAWTKAAPLTNR
jgi:hypothetical protein